MSRIGKKPISVPAGVKLEQKSGQVKISGPLGNIEIMCRPQIEVKLDSATNSIIVTNKNPQITENNQLHGTMRALLANMVEGVTKGFENKR